MLQKYKVLLLHMLWWRQKNHHYHRFSRISLATRTCFLEHQHSMPLRFGWLLFLSPLHPLLYPLKFLCLFSSCSIDHSLYCFCWLFECMWWQPHQTAKLYCQYACLWQAIKEGHDLMQRKKTPMLTKSVHSYKISKSFFLHRNSCCCHSIFTSMVKFPLILSTDITSLSRVRNIIF